jgi:anti-sigma factor RsiW
MTDPESTSDGLDERTLADLTRLADGTLQGSRRTALEARVAESPELAAALERQRVARSALGAISMPAPLALRTRIEHERTRPMGRVRRRRAGILGGLVGIAAALVLLLVVVLPTGSGGPTISEAAELSSLPATETDVPVDAGNAKLLDASQSGVPFPNLVAGDFGWRPAGERTDRLDGRDTTTVFYEKGGKRIGYTILSGDPIDPPGDSNQTDLNGVSLHVTRDGSKQIVTWLRQGKTCVLSGEGVGSRELLTLASWKGEGTVPF